MAGSSLYVDDHAKRDNRGGKVMMRTLAPMTTDRLFSSPMPALQHERVPRHLCWHGTAGSHLDVTCACCLPSFRKPGRKVYVSDDIGRFDFEEEVADSIHQGCIRKILITRTGTPYPGGRARAEFH